MNSTQHARASAHKARAFERTNARATAQDRADAQQARAIAQMDRAFAQFDPSFVNDFDPAFAINGLFAERALDRAFAQQDRAFAQQQARATAQQARAFAQPRATAQQQARASAHARATMHTLLRQRRLPHPNHYYNTEKYLLELVIKTIIVILSILTIIPILKYIFKLHIFCRYWTIIGCAFVQKFQYIKTRKLTQQRIRTGLRNLFSRGMRREAEDEAKDVGEILKNQLANFGITGALSVSICASFVSCFFMIVHLYRARHSKQSKGWIITSLVSGITSLLLQIFCISYPDAEVATDIKDVTRVMIEEAVSPKMTKQQIVDLVNSKTLSLDEANDKIYTFNSNSLIERIPVIPPSPENIISILSVGPLESFISVNNYAICFWTPELLVRHYWKLPTTSRLVFNSKFKPKENLLNIKPKPEPAKVKSKGVVGSLENPKIIRPKELKFVGGKILSDYDTVSATEDEVEQIPPTKIKFDIPSVTKTDFFKNAKQQAAGSNLKYWITQILAFLASLVTMCLAKKKTSCFKEIMGTWQGVDFLSGKFDDILVKWGEFNGEETEQDKLHRQIQVYIEELTELLSISQAMYASRQDLREKLNLAVTTVEKFLKIPMDPKIGDKAVLMGLYASASKFRLEVLRSAKTNTVRQEPRLVLFYGKGGCGKSNTMQYLANKIGEAKFSDIDPMRRVIGLTPRSKYFPVLGGEPIWTIDELGGAVNYENDIILRDIRGLCSPARFGADTAELMGKDQGAEPKIIIATTNTPPDIMLQRLADTQGPESCAPIAARILFYELERNVKVYGPITAQNRDTAPFDTTGNFKHVIYKKLIYDENIGKYISTATVRFGDIVDETVATINHLESQHVEKLQSLEDKRKMMAGSSQMIQSVTHFVINLHGQPRTGKGKGVDEILPQLHKFTNYPVINIKSMVEEWPKVDRRSIVIFDDVFSCDAKVRQSQELKYQNFYNNCPGGCIFILATNLIPHNYWPKFQIVPYEFEIFGLAFSVPLIQLQIQQHLVCSEPGVLRRMGFVGSFYKNTTNDTDCCYYVDCDKYYPSKTQNEATYSIDVISGTIFVLGLIVTFLWSYFGLIMCGPLIWNAMKMTKYHNKLDLPSLHMDIMKKYKNHLISQKECVIRYGAAVVDNPDVILIADSVTSVLSAGYVEMASHVFLNAKLFAETPMDWKIYINPNIASNMAVLAKRLCHAIPQTDSVESVIDYIKNIRSGLAQNGNQITLQANIRSLGQIVLKDTEIIVDRRNCDTNGEFEVVTKDPRFVIIVPKEGEEGGSRTISWQAIADFHINATPIVDLANEQIHVASGITRILHSHDIIASPYYAAARRDVFDAKVKRCTIIKMKEWQEKVTEFFRTTTGKIILAIVTVLVIVVVTGIIVKIFKARGKTTKSKKKSRQTVKSSTSESETETETSDDELHTTTDDEDEIGRQRKGSKGKKKDPLHSDGEKTRQKKGKGNKKTRPTSDDDSHFKKQVFSDEDTKPTDQQSRNLRQATIDQFCVTPFSKCKTTAVPQNIQELPDMNGYSEFKLTLKDWEKKLDNNSCWVFSCKQNDNRLTFDDDKHRDSVIKKARCYGLFIRGTEVVTVGHMAEYVNDHKENLFVCSDEMKDGKGNSYAVKLHLVKDFSKENRDLSFWIVNQAERNKVPSYADITGRFAPTFAQIPEISNTILKRYGVAKSPEYLYGAMLYEKDEVMHDYTDKGKPFTVTNYGFTLFGFCTFALTTFGDCGLPYFNVNENNQMFVSGIHCMGNTRNSMSVGVAAVIAREDFKCFEPYREKVLKQTTQEEKCEYCNKKKHHISRPLPAKQETADHEIVWNRYHPANFKSFIAEVAHYYQRRLPGDVDFVGKVRKSAGATSQGTVEHSHTHFIPDGRVNFLTDAMGWSEVKTEKWGKCLVWIGKTEGLRAVEKWSKKHPGVVDFVLSADSTVYRPIKTTSVWKIQILVTKHVMTQEEMDELLNPRAQQHLEILEDDGLMIDGNEYYCPKDLAECVVKANLMKHPHDVPIPRNQETVALLGSFKSNQSHTPVNNYINLASGRKLENTDTKVPFNANAYEAPEEQWDQLVMGEDGTIDARVTQSVQWQGNHKTLKGGAFKIAKNEYKIHLRKLYGNLRELTDKEVLHGTRDALKGGLEGLELKRSIGWSMTSLFKVTQKEDVIDLDERGVYSWKTNPAALYLKDWYHQAVQHVRKGIRPFTVYLELCKMEKLKPEKNFLGRIFCAADFISVLLQRKFLGHFVAISTLKDDVVGVGSNPWVVFHEIGCALQNKAYWFTGDYKRWDKTVPRQLFIAMGQMLDEINKTNVYSLVLQDIWNSVHVSGKTMFQKMRGMPSGAVVTANLNSKINDFAIFCVFIKLGQTKSIGTSYEEFNQLVYRKFYGDDVILGVDESIADWFNMETVREALQQDFGFVLDSSEKDGSRKRFMEWEELSWCSRYLRKLESRFYYVGALKKQTIVSMIHWTRRTNSKLEICQQLSNALFEAGAWDREFFNSISRDIDKICAGDKYLQQNTLKLTYEQVQLDMYDQGVISRWADRYSRLVAAGLTPPESDYNDIIVEINRYSEFCSQTKATIKKYTWNSWNTSTDTRDVSKALKMFSASTSTSEPKMNTQVCMTEDDVNARNDGTNSDFVSQLNRKAQAGEITMPTYSFGQAANLAWHCHCETQKVGCCEPIVKGMGIGQSKTIAKENAAQDAFNQLFHKREYRSFKIKNLMSGGKQEMNMSGGDSIPVVKSTGTDISLTAGSQVFTNTAFAQGATNINPVAFALNNVAQTGAPFDAKDSIYSIFQLEGSYTVSNVQGVGTEVFRLSLDPARRSALQKAYISMHEDHIPHMDFGVYLGGTPGALGTLKIGFVKDITKKAVSLAELQSIACQDVALSQSSTVSFTVPDIRKNGLYRKTLNDPEPYPGIVALVSNPITNVQRNDAVQYPIQIYSKLNPGYILASPIIPELALDQSTHVRLESFLDKDSFDLVISNSTMALPVTDLADLDDCGWLSQRFAPQFTEGHVVDFSIGGNKGLITYVVGEDANLNDLRYPPNLVNGQFQGSVNQHVVFGYGKVPIITRGSRENLTVDDMGRGGTMVNIPPMYLRASAFSYTCITMVIFEEGVKLIFSLAEPTEPTINGRKVQLWMQKPQANATQLNIGFMYDDDFPIRPAPALESTALVWDTGNKRYTVCTTIAYDRHLNYPFKYGMGYFLQSTGSYTVGEYRMSSSWKDETPDGRADVFSLYANQATTEALPVGLKRLFLVRPGTSITQDMPVIPPYSAGKWKLQKHLDSLANELGTTWLKLSYTMNDIQVHFEVAYSDGVFLVKTNESNLVRVSQATSVISLRDITPIFGPGAINQLASTNSFDSWLGKSQLKYKMKSYLFAGSSQQMMGATIAGALAGGASSYGQWAMNSENWRQHKNMISMQYVMQARLDEMRNQRRLSQMGYNSNAAAKGNTRDFQQKPSGGDGGLPAKQLEAEQEKVLGEDHNYGINDSAIHEAAGVPKTPQPKTTFDNSMFPKPPTHSISSDDTDSIGSASDLLESSIAPTPEQSVSDMMKFSTDSESFLKTPPRNYGVTNYDLGTPTSLDSTSTMSFGSNPSNMSVDSWPVATNIRAIAENPRRKLMNGDTDSAFRARVQAKREKGFNKQPDTDSTLSGAFVPQNTEVGTPVSY